MENQTKAYPFDWHTNCKGPVVYRINGRTGLFFVLSPGTAKRRIGKGCRTVIFNPLNTILTKLTPSWFLLSLHRTKHGSSFSSLLLASHFPDFGCLMFDR